MGPWTLGFWLMTHLKGEAPSWFFSLWGYLKSIVCATAADYVEEAQQRVAYTCELVLNTPGIFERLRQSSMRCVACCEEEKG